MSRVSAANGWHFDAAVTKTELEMARFDELFGHAYYQPELLEAAEVVGTAFRAPSMVRSAAAPLHLEVTHHPRGSKSALR